MAGCEAVLVKYATTGQAGSEYLTFDKIQDECGPTNTVSWSIGYEDELRYVSEQISAGRIVLKIYRSGELSKIGKEVEQGLKAVLVRPRAPTDFESLRQQAKFMAMVSKGLADYQSKVIASIENSTVNADKINVQVMLQIQEWDATVEESRSEAMNALVNGKVAKENLQSTIDFITKSYPATKDALELDQQAYDDLKKGMLSAYDIATIHDRIDADLKNFSKSMSLDALNGITAVANREKNELRKRQYLNILSEFFDKNGLVKSWVLTTGQNLNLKSSADSTEGQRIRSSLNSIMGAMTAKISNGTLELQDANRSQAAIDILAMSDEEVVSEVKAERNRGLSYVGYMYAFSGFETGATFSAELNSAKLSQNVVYFIPQSQALNDMTGYERYVLVSTLNRLSADVLRDPYLNLLVRNCVDHATLAMENKLLPAFQAVIERIKSINEFQGGLLDGIYSGIADTVVELAKMPGHILHPFDTRDAIVDAIIDYKGTWAAIRPVLLNDYEKLASCRSNLRDCGEVVGRISFQIGQLVLGAGYLKGAATSEKIGMGIDAAASKLANQGADTIARTAEMGFAGRTNFERALKIADPLDGSLGKLTDAVAGAERSGLSLAKSAEELPKYLPQPYWPPNDGFLGASTKKFIYPGERIDRFGFPKGYFVSPLGVPFEGRSLPQSFLTSKPYSVYEVLKPFEVDAGPAAPWFSQPGYGMQYQLPVTVELLLKQGIIKEVVE